MLQNYNSQHMFTTFYSISRYQDAQLLQRKHTSVVITPFKVIQGH